MRGKRIQEEKTQRQGRAEGIKIRMMETINDSNMIQTAHASDRQLMPRTDGSCLRQTAHAKESPNFSDSMVEILPLSITPIHRYGFSHPNMDDISTHYEFEC